MELLKIQIPGPYLSLEYSNLGTWVDMQTLGTDIQCER